MTNSSKILVTGTKSGLGQYLHRELGGTGLTRENTKEVFATLKNGVDLVVHCAFNPRSDFFLSSAPDYVGDNVLLTEQLAQVPHQKFIYISSIDVYPISNELHHEEEVIDTNLVSGIYGITKLASESIVKRRCKDWLILRGVGFLGAYGRKNSCRKIIEDDPCELTLAPDSIFNYVRHTDILKFIRLAIDKNLKGIYNLASSENATLREIAALFAKKVSYGTYRYNVGRISNKKIASFMPEFSQSTLEVVKKFAAEDLQLSAKK